LHIGFGTFDVAPIQVDFGKVVPHPKQTSKAYVILEGY
jgi:hypothetical protein